MIFFLFLVAKHLVIFVIGRNGQMERWISQCVSRSRHVCRMEFGELFIMILLAD
jgi:hypothetical protein